MSHLHFSLSVDDGHPLDLRLAEMLERHAISATFYVPIKNKEGPPVMQASELRELSKHFEIGSHTLDHLPLPGLSLQAAWHQISAGKRALEDCLGQPVAGFCYPHGAYRQEHRALVQVAGFQYARTTKNLYLNTRQEAYALPTTLQFYPHPRQVLVRNFISQRDWRARWPHLQQALAENHWIDRLYRLLHHGQQVGEVFHLWCHSIDIERLALWSAMDDFLACVSRRIPPDCRVCNGKLLAMASPFHTIK
jgi:peptidoglycan/xylan/chitin deacetylase (PgdA/CDA1 family)